MHGKVLAILVEQGASVAKGERVAVVEAMKMEHEISAPHAGIVRGVTMAAGDVVREGFAIVFIQQTEVEGDAVIISAELDPEHIRPDLRETYDRHALTLDGLAVLAPQRTHRECVADAPREHAGSEDGHRPRCEAVRGPREAVVAAGQHAIPRRCISRRPLMAHSSSYL